MERRILYVTKTPPSGSGIARYGRDFSEALGTFARVELVSSGNEALETKRLASVARLLVQVLRRISRLRPDIVHFELSGGAIAEVVTALAVSYLPARRRPVVTVTAHDPPVLSGGLFDLTVLDRRGGRRVSRWLSRTAGWRLERALLGRSDVVMTLSIRGARSLRRNFRLDRMVQPIPHVARVSRAPKTALVVFFAAPAVGRTVVEGLWAIADHVDRVSRVLVGPGAARDLAEIRTSVEELHLDGLVDFTGVLAQTELDEAYAAASIVVRVVPANDPRWQYANSDAVSGPVVGGLAAACVVLSNPTLATAEYLHDASNGVFLDRSDTRYRDRLGRLLTDDDYRSALQSGAAELAATHLAPEVVGRRVQELLAASMGDGV
jgi:glycosyltransferase involved in cell wall biosynthesis